MCEPTYALGHSPADIQPLKNQGAMLRPITERLLPSPGIDAGMRVPNLGYRNCYYPHLVVAGSTNSQLALLRFDRVVTT